MVRRAKEERVTIVGRLKPDSIALTKLITLMRKFRDAVEYAHTLLFRERLDEAEVKRKLTGILSNAWYASSVIKVAKLYKNQHRLKLRKPLLYSLGGRVERGNRNIRLITADKVLIKIPHADGKHEWVEVGVSFGKKYLTLIEELISGDYAYGAGVTIKLKNRSDNWRKHITKNLYLYLNIPEKLYLKYFRKNVKSHTRNLIAGFDFNVDRINMVIIDFSGRLRDHKSIHFPEAIMSSREKAKALRQEALAKLVKYASNHGVNYFGIEKLSKPKNASGKVGRWSIGDYGQQMRVLVKKASGRLIEINPAYTTIEALAIASRLGLDVHTTSAYIIALRTLKHIKDHERS